VQSDDNDDDDDDDDDDAVSEVDPKSARPRWVQPRISGISEAGARHRMLDGSKRRDETR
jgi:hypothetical protein